MSHGIFVANAFETEPLNVGQPSLTLTALLPQSLECWIRFQVCTTSLSLSKLLRISELFPHLHNVVSKNAYLRGM